MDTNDFIRQGARIYAEIERKREKEDSDRFLGDKFNEIIRELYRMNNNIEVIYNWLISLEERTRK